MQHTFQVYHIFTVKQESFKVVSRSETAIPNRTSVLHSPHQRGYGIAGHAGSGKKSPLSGAIPSRKNVSAVLGF
jgi:hypothetical protein